MILPRRPIPTATLLLAAGIVFRLAAYLANRGYWSDEASLHDNLVGRPPLDFTTPLSNTQLAPPLYIAFERALIATFGDTPSVARLPSLMAGIASLFLFRRLADRLLPTRAALLALALLVVSDEQIYFATELKPYVLDVAIALVIALVSLNVLNPSSSSVPRPASRVPSLAAFAGALAIGLSFPAVFALAAAGLAGCLDAQRRRDLRRFAAWSLAGLFWIAALFVTRAAAFKQLGGHDGMWHFWNFAFPPAPTVDPLWIPRRLLFLFISPLDWHGPIDPRLSALPAIVCAITGLARLGRSQPLPTLVILGPIGFALLAAALRLYPFHGRCLLFAVPALLLLVAAGAAFLMDRIGRLGRVVLIFALLAFPTCLSLYALIEPRQRTGLNPHGDRRPASMSPDIFGPPLVPHPSRGA